MSAIYRMLFALIDRQRVEGLQCSAGLDAMLSEMWSDSCFDAVSITDADRRWARHAAVSMLGASSAETYSEQSELVYAANVSLSAIEQRRADRQIGTFFGSASFIPAGLPKFMRRAVERNVALVKTRWFAKFLTPDGFLSVAEEPKGRTERYWRGENTLSELSHPLAVEAHQDFVNRHLVRASDWTDYWQRMSYISEFFRHHQELRGFRETELLVST